MEMKMSAKVGLEKNARHVWHVCPLRGTVCC